MRRKDETDAEERAQRLAAALRENLKRRKAQARGRDAIPPAVLPATPDVDNPAGSPSPRTTDGGEG